MIWRHVQRTPEGFQVGLRIVAAVHDEADCAQDSVCVMHRPSRHGLSSWPLLWREDRKIVERLCNHGVGHPDPDQWPYWGRAGRMYEQVHGCDGCCVG